MSRRPSASHMLALKAAAAVAAQDRQDEEEVAPQPEPQAAAPEPVPEPAPAQVEAEADPGRKAPGRPKGRRPVAARQTVYLDEARHAALARIAEDRGRSIHSLILEGVDHVIGKPTRVGWQV